MGDARNSIWEMDFDPRAHVRSQPRVRNAEIPRSAARKSRARERSSPSNLQSGGIRNFRAMRRAKKCRSLATHISQRRGPRISPTRRVAGTQPGLESFQREFSGVFVVSFFLVLLHSRRSCSTRRSSRVSTVRERRHLIYFARDKRATCAVRRCLKIPP